jgi:polyhydroxyalkanoate synthesis repressor PhaR
VAQKSRRTSNGPKRPNGKETTKRRRGRPTRQEAQARQEEYARFEGERLIHRYGNRRFYDLEGKRAITLDEIAELVRQGENVRVLDVDAGNEDITRRVLTQIILESKAQQNLELLPVEFLRKLIATHDQKVGQWLDAYLKTGAEMLDRGLREGIALSTVYQKQAADLLRGIMPVFPAKPYPSPVPTKTNRERDREIAELRRRLDELAKEK